MKATELRIFNLFYPIDRTNNVHLPIESAFKVLTIGFKIEAIPYNKVPAQVEKWSEFDSKDLSPIPLTEEWLLKFGFKPLVKDWQIKGLIIHTRKRGYVVKKSMPILQYVHQLQNLYFALTGEELKIKTA